MISEKGINKKLGCFDPSFFLSCDPFYGHLLVDAVAGNGLGWSLKRRKESLPLTPDP